MAVPSSSGDIYVLPLPPEGGSLGLELSEVPTPAGDAWVRCAPVADGVCAAERVPGGLLLRAGRPGALRRVAGISDVRAAIADARGSESWAMCVEVRPTVASFSVQIAGDLGLEWEEAADAQGGGCLLRVAGVDRDGAAAAAGVPAGHYLVRCDMCNIRSWQDLRSVVAYARRCGRASLDMEMAHPVEEVLGWPFWDRTCGGGARRGAPAGMGGDDGAAAPAPAACAEAPRMVRMDEAEFAQALAAAKAAGESPPPPRPPPAAAPFVVPVHVTPSPPSPPPPPAQVRWDAVPLAPGSQLLLHLQ